MNLVARDFDRCYLVAGVISDSVTKKPDTAEVLFLGGPPQFLLTCKVGWNHILLKGC